MADAVSVDPLRPKEMLLLFENTNWSLMLLDVVPPLKFNACCAVIVLPLSPKLTRLELENTRLDMFPLVVPALKLTLP